jgi:hypothetical protein
MGDYTCAQSVIVHSARVHHATVSQHHSLGPIAVEHAPWVNGNRTRSARVLGERSSWRGSWRAVGVTRQWRGGGLGPCVAAVPDQRPVAPLTGAQDVMIPRRAVAADAMASRVPQQANHPGR